MHQAHCISDGKSVHWNSKRMNGTNCEHTEPINLEMYMGRLKSNVVFFIIESQHLYIFDGPSFDSRCLVFPLFGY